MSRSLGTPRLSWRWKELTELLRVVPALQHAVLRNHAGSPEVARPLQRCYKRAVLQPSPHPATSIGQQPWLLFCGNAKACQRCRINDTRRAIRTESRIWASFRHATSARVRMALFVANTTTLPDLRKSAKACWTPSTCHQLVVWRRAQTTNTHQFVAPSANISLGGVDESNPRKHQLVSDPDHAVKVEDENIHTCASRGCARSRKAVSGLSKHDAEVLFRSFRAAVSSSSRLWDQGAESARLGAALRLSTACHARSLRPQ